MGGGVGKRGVWEERRGRGKEKYDRERRKRREENCWKMVKKGEEKRASVGEENEKGKVDYEMRSRR